MKSLFKSTNNKPVTPVAPITGYPFEALTGSCFVNPDLCLSGTSIGMKLLKSESTNTKNGNNEEIVFILKSEGVEVFEDKYGRLCGLVRMRYPSREWKVIV